jgi:hypothetical protein
MEQQPKGMFEDLPWYANLGLDLMPVVGDVKSGVEAADYLSKGMYSDAALAGLGLLPFVPSMAGSIKNVMKDPEKTVEAYKLFRTDPNKPGELFPLFVNANKGVEQNKWVPAEIGPRTEKGGVKSKIGELAFRPGWHAGDYVAATHIGGKATKGATKPEYRPANQVWAAVDLPADVDWQTVANSRAGVIKSGPNKGKMNAAEAQIADQIPEGGYYRYKTNPNMMGNWLIGGSMRVNRQLSPEEIKQIQETTKIFDLPSLPEYIDQKGLKFDDLTKEAQKELKQFYPAKYAELTGTQEYVDVFSNPLMKDSTR